MLASLFAEKAVETLSEGGENRVVGLQEGADAQHEGQVAEALSGGKPVKCHAVRRSVAWRGEGILAAPLSRVVCQRNCQQPPYQLTGP